MCARPPTSATRRCTALAVLRTLRCGWRGDRGVRALPPGPWRQQDVLALRTARELVQAGKPVSQRALRSHGVKGSNEGLSALARKLDAQLANDWT